MKILVIGSGAREHALCWRFRQDPACTSLYCAPGNAGIAAVAVCLPIKAEDIAGMSAWCVAERPDLVVIGPDAVLELGMTDALEALGIPVFGPTRAAARIEWSKAFMKDICAQAGIPTARYGRFTDLAPAAAFIDGMTAPIVVKADGLAAGKGVIICDTKDEAVRVAADMLSGQSFGAAGKEIVVEAFLQGFEVSYFALVDGHTVVPVASAQDHKRVGEKDTGPNTGGMGAISPAPGFTTEIEQKVLATVIQPLADALVANGTPYRGVVFAGLMIEDGMPTVIEFNARWGDPETQSIMCRWTGDAISYFLATATGTLASLPLAPVMSSETALGVFICTRGYPDTYNKHTPIKLPDMLPQNTALFHAGTALQNGQLVNTGGRTITVVAIGPDAATAQRDAYKLVDAIDWPDGFCRRDIGWRAVTQAAS